MKSGLASSAKMAHLMKNTLKSTTKEWNNQLSIMMKLCGQFEYYMIEMSQESFISKLESRISTTKKRDKNTRMCLNLALADDSSRVVFFDLWRELGEAIRALMCGNYKSVYRSLRWIIEATIFWAEMQTDLEKAKTYFQDYYEQRDNLTKSEYQILLREITSVSSAILEERLFLKDKYKLVRIEDALRSIRVLKNRPEYDGSKLRNSLSKAYRKFSGYSHMSLETVIEIRYEKLHRDFAFYQDYEYSRPLCESSIEASWRTIDLVMSLIILVQSWFMDFEVPQMLIEELGPTTTYLKSLLRKIPASEKLPYLNGIFFPHKV